MFMEKHKYKKIANFEYFPQRDLYIYVLNFYRKRKNFLM